MSARKERKELKAELKQIDKGIKVADEASKKSWFQPIVSKKQDRARAQAFADGAKLRERRDALLSR